jgi:hypothetical protein
LRNGTHTTCTTAVVTWRERAARSACQFAAPRASACPGGTAPYHALSTVYSVTSVSVYMQYWVPYCHF